MKYKIGDSINCYVETTDKGVKRIVRHKTPDKEKFKIIWIDLADKQYVVAVDANMLGWGLSEWHLAYWDLDKKYLSMKHFQVPIEEE